MKLKNKILVTGFGVAMAFFTVVSAGCKLVPGDNSDNSAGGDISISVSTDGGEKEWISSDWTEIPENTNENLKYFGYFHSDGFGSQQGSYISEIAALGNANIVMINSAWDANEALNNLAEAKACGMEAIVSVHSIFQGGVTGKLDSCRLKDNWQESWDTYQTTVQSYIDDGTIYAFYFDEPRWNGIGAEDFKTATKYIREKADVGVMACMTAMDIGVGNYGGVGECEDDYMQYCTDVMFDTYGNWDDEARRGYLEMLKAKSPEDAWIWGCPKGFEAEPEINGVEIMANHIKGQYTEAIQDERYAGIISFSYATGTSEGDWGYGLCDFFNDQHDYYSKELKDLYTEIGCAITGMTPPEMLNLDFVVKEATETYKLNDQIPLPEATASDENGKNYAVNMTVTAPDGSAVAVTDGAFTGTQTGGYKVACAVEFGGKSYEKETYLYVKETLEISTFESVAFDKDHTGDDDDKWCWPRSLDLTFGHNGSKGSLKVTPHATDGNWPNVYFRVNGKKKIDITPYGGFSAWIYNDGNEDVTTMGIKFNNGQNYKEATKVFTLKAKEWTYVSVTNTEMEQLASGIDLTQVNIAICNSLTPYTNRAVFYIDDVYFLPAGAQPELPATDETTLIGFEGDTAKKYITQDADSLWCWPSEISSEQVKSGSNALKITPHPTDGTWPIIGFNFFNSATFDMSDYDKVSVWAYNAGSTTIEGFSFVGYDGNGASKLAIVDMPAGQWVEFALTKSELQEAGVDVTAMGVRFSNSAATYENRSVFYLDNAQLSVGGVVDPDPEPDPDPVVTTVDTIGFETADEKAYVVQDADSLWCWPTAISNEMAKSGSYALKITPHATDGMWPKLALQFGSATFDLTNYDQVSLWVYNAGDSDLINFGMTVLDASGAKAECVKNVPAGVWTEFVVTKAMLTAKNMNVTALTLEFGNCNSDYPNRAAFYIDDVQLAKAAPAIATQTIGFESEAELANAVYEGENQLFWVPSISNEQAKSGNSSLKITPHAEWGTWPYINFKFGESATFDMTNYSKVSLWLYNSGTEDIPNFGITVYNGEKKVDCVKNVVAGQWTEYVVTKDALLAAGVDITALSIKLGNYNSDYTNRVAFYIDDVQLS